MTLLTVVLISAVTRWTHKSPPRTPFAKQFYEETEKGIDALFPAGLDDGVFTRLEDGKVTFYEMDGSSSDNRLNLEPYYGHYTVRENKLTITVDGRQESAEYEIQKAPHGLEEHHIRYCLVGEGLNLGYAPVDLKAEIERSKKLQSKSSEDSDT